MYVCRQVLSIHTPQMQVDLVVLASCSTRTGYTEALLAFLTGNGYACVAMMSHGSMVWPMLEQSCQDAGSLQEIRAMWNQRTSSQSAGSTGLTTGLSDEDRMSPSTGTSCNTIFSRPYELTRHGDTILRCEMSMRNVHEEVAPMGHSSAMDLPRSLLADASGSSSQQCSQ